MASFSKSTTHKIEIKNQGVEVQNNSCYIKSSDMNVEDMYIDDTSVSETVDFEEVYTTTDVNLVNNDGYLTVNCDLQAVADKFGGQADDSGVYPLAEGDCDNYSRGYCLYIQTGKVADFNDVGVGGCGLERKTFEADNRKEQAQAVYDRLMEGKPCIIHVNSSTGNGHWMCVVGFKDGTTRDNIKIDDLLVIDSAGDWGADNSAKVMACSDNPVYCTDGVDNCFYDPGYQVIYYD